MILTILHAKKSSQAETLQVVSTWFRTDVCQDFFSSFRPLSHFKFVQTHFFFSRHTFFVNKSLHHQGRPRWILTSNYCIYIHIQSYRGRKTLSLFKFHLLQMPHVRDPQQTIFTRRRYLMVICCVLYRYNFELMS